MKHTSNVKALLSPVEQLGNQKNAKNFDAVAIVETGKKCYFMRNHLHIKLKLCERRKVVIIINPFAQG